MDNYSYLQKISVKPPKTATPLFSKKIIIPLIAVAVISILIIIFGLIFGRTPKSLDSTLRLNARTTNLIKTLDTYNKNLKSSDLRAMGSSLKTILQSTSAPLASSVKDDFGKVNKSTSESIASEETDYITNVNTTLENARLNAILDRTYVNEIGYQIAMLRALEQECYDTTKNDALKSSLESSMSSLNNLYEQFANFTDKTN